MNIKGAGPTRKGPWPDVAAGTVVFLISLPLCLGVSLASGAPLFAGLWAGVVGGILVGALSGSHTSVSGPAAGMAAVVAAQIALLGSYRAFLAAVVLAGAIQIVLGLVRVGFIASFFPTSVIKGLLAAIGLILIIKQIPHLIGYDAYPLGDLGLQQSAQPTRMFEFTHMLEQVHPGAVVISIVSLVILFTWERNAWLKRRALPAPLIVVVLGIVIFEGLDGLGGVWALEAVHRVQVPVAENVAGFLNLFATPDLSQLANPKLYGAALTVALVASLETLLNLEAIDKLDPRQRHSPANRELIAQGTGNIVCGLFGGLPLTSVLARGSVNVQSGAQTKLAAIVQGGLLLVTVVLLPQWLNLIPLPALAAILFATGLKLASPALIRSMWSQGRQQFIPFAVTVLGIVLSDFLSGVLLGLGAALAFMLVSSIRRPIHRALETHFGGDVMHIELADQVSFLNRAALVQSLEDVKPNTHVLLDARRTNYIDPDLISLIRDYQEKTAPARGVEVSLIGFQERYGLGDRMSYVGHSTRELQSALTPARVLELLMEGHSRFRSGRRLTRAFERDVLATAGGQHPLAVVLSCIDSRTPTELIFDLGVGDVFTVRVAGNIPPTEVLGSVEYACAVAGAKLIFVLGHTRCGAVTAAVDLRHNNKTALEATGCEHLDSIVDLLQHSVPTAEGFPAPFEHNVKSDFVEKVARHNVLRTVQTIKAKSQTLAKLIADGKIAIVGGIYDVSTAAIELLPTETKTDVAARQSDL